jgi:ubiquinone/menaquinone biosynthesis C-methylase UbiE
MVNMTEKRNFDKEAASWDEKSSRIKLARDITEAILSNVALNSKMKVLDFGCGTGLVTLKIAPHVDFITGVDSSQGMLDVINEKIINLNIKNARTQLIDLENDDELPGEYDLITSSMTFHHIHDIGTLLSKFFQALNPSGCICIADLDSENGGFHNDNTGVFHHGFDRSNLRKKFLNAGFTDIHDFTAAEIEKETSNGEIQKFSVFLMTGYKH